MKRLKTSQSHYRLFTGNMGKLIPTMCRPVLPGDTWRKSSTVFCRIAPLNAPVMHPVHIKVHDFFVPMRLVWDNWENFITGGPDGLNADTIPKIDLQNSSVTAGSLLNHLGVPVNSFIPGTPFLINALPLRAAQLVWNEHFRDQDLQTKLTVSTANGPDTTTSRVLQSVCWQKDRFTTARLYPEKGGAVSIPMGLTEAPVIGNGDQVNVRFSGAPTTERPLITGTATGTTVFTLGSALGAQPNNVSWSDDPAKSGLIADLDDLPGTIRELREAVAIQRFRDRMMRAGSRYVDYLKSSFGVRSSDARLQRPELLHSSSTTVQFSEVLQTAPDVDSGTSEDFGVATMKGHGLGSYKTPTYQRFFEEHGYIISFMTVVPIPMYVQGLEKEWLRTTKEDYYDKDLALIGEEEVYNKELYQVHATPDGVFGYQRRYYDYLNTLSSIAGEFCTTEANFWHMARNFSSDVALNSSFVTADPTDRIYAVPSEDQLYCMVRHNAKARRAIVAPASAKIL